MYQGHWDSVTMYQPDCDWIYSDVTKTAGVEMPQNFYPLWLSATGSDQTTETYA